MRLHTTIGIDPGPEENAVVSLSGPHIDLCTQRLPHDIVVADCSSLPPGVTLAVEDFVPYAQRLGYESMATIKFIGVLEWLFPEAVLISRPEVKLHLCGKKTATDAEVRDALIQRFGPGKKRAVGTKKSPGPLYGVKGHCWAALAVAVVSQDQIETEPEAEC